MRALGAGVFYQAKDTDSRVNGCSKVNSRRGMATSNHVQHADNSDAIGVREQSSPGGPGVGRRSDNRMSRARYESFQLGWLLAVVLFVLIGTCAYYLSRLHSLVQDHRPAALLFEQSLQASIDQFEYLPALLAHDPEVVQLLKEANLATHPGWLLSTTESRLRQKLNETLQFITLRSGGDRVYLMRANGDVVASSNYQENASFIGANYGFRPYFKRAMESGQRQFYFAKGASTGIPGFFISEAVFDADGVAIGTAVVKLELDFLMKSWKEAKEHVLVSDENGVVILSSEADWMYKSIAPLSQEVRRALASARQFPLEDHPLLYDHAAGLGGVLQWTIDDERWVVDSYPIERTQWRMHQVIRHKSLVMPTLQVMGLLSLFGGVCWLLVAERRKKFIIAERARVAELRRREDLQRLIDNIHTGVLILDQAGKILSINQYSERQLAIGEQELSLSPSIYQLLNIEDAKPLSGFLVEDMDNLQYFETQAKRTEAPLMFALAKLNYNGIDSLLMTMVNIAKRKRAEQALVELNESLEDSIAERTRELEQAQAALLQKNKAEALGKMAATIVHELSQPLSAMNSSVAAIEGKIKQENWMGARESAMRLKPLSTRMSRIIQLLKHFSYDEGEGKQISNLGEHVRQVVDVTADQIQERGIQLKLVDQLPEWASEQPIGVLKLDLILTNLLRNAIDAVEGRPSPEIQIGLYTDDSNIRIDVSDNGGGVEHTIMNQLFNAYFTTKEVGKGMGLGLSISQEIAQQLQGQLLATNTAEGACFSLVLPNMADQPAQQPEKHTALLSDHSGSRIHKDG